MSNFSFLDGSIVGVYIMICITAGVLVRKYVGRVEDFLVAGRQMDLFLGIASLAATEFGIVTCMYTAQNGYDKGFAGATPGILLALAMFFVGTTGFCIKPLRKAGVITIPELFEKRFGPRVRWMSGVVIVLGGLLNMGLFLRAGADFVLVRVVNETGQNAEFIVTIEREVIERDEEGNPLADTETGVIITRPERETVRLNTAAQAPANEVGVLFSCSESPVNVVGLGENLLPNDAAVFVGGGGAGGAPGFGVPAATVNPLMRVPPNPEDPSNFNCGDTVMFRAIRSTGVTGGVKLESFLLPGYYQPSVFTGPSTFVNYQSFLESQNREDEP